MNNKAVMLGLSVLAFLVAAALVIMIFRMLFGGRLRMPGGRARQARLGIVDAFDLDRQRQLIIVRRDNTEHLIMIGGPNDVVIESEIVRAEARDLRDQRREPGTAPTIGDGRIPAPGPAFDKVGPGSQMPPPLQRPSEEPMLPMPVLNDQRNDIGTEPPRGPTFPLPPRRPMPPLAPERRPPAPPRLPDSVSRGDDVPAFSGQPAGPAPAPPAPLLSPGPSVTTATVSPVVAPPVASPPPLAPPPSPPPSAPTARPPFLKPLPPRPPIRPLQRTTPQAPSMTPAPVASPPNSAASPPIAPPKSSPPPQAPPPSAPESQDALESLEEEMAKLLGRGS